MEQVTLLGKKERISFIFFVLFFCFIYYLTAEASLVPAWDLSRYYESVDSFPVSYTFMKVIRDCFQEGNDFIYYLMLFFAKKVGVPYDIITALIVTIYYILIIKIIKEQFSNQIAWYLIIVSMFAVNITWVISISRNLTAYMFLYAGVLFYYRKRRWWCALFFLASVLTHFSTIMYVAIILASWFYKGVHVNSWVVFVAVSAFLLLSFVVPDSVGTLMNMVLAGSDSYYLRYTESFEAKTFISYGNQNYGTLALVLYSLIYSIVLLLLNKKQGAEFLVLFIATVLLAFFLNSSMMFSNRCLMFMPLFWALNMASAYTSGSKREKEIIKYLSIAGLVAILLVIYADRDFYFYFMYDDAYRRMEL